MTSTAAPFDISGPLPVTRTAIEASAGTGKTYSIAGLVTRVVAETEHRIGELLVITFTRAATAELRHRIRSKLVEAVAHLRFGAAPDDDVLRALADPEDLLERARRIERLELAVAEFDTATVSTIHGFCQRVLRAAGVVGGDLADTVTNDDTVLDEALNDALAAAALAPEPLVIAPERAREAVVALLRNPRARHLPGSTDDVSDEVRRIAAVLIGVAETIRARHRAAGTATYDDLLLRASDVLRDDLLRGRVAGELLARYPVAFVDEAQDTDPLQWEILSALYPPPDGRLVLVGDPKQSIYAFRGADVHAYLDAAADAEVRSLSVNHRSDEPLLRAVNAVFQGATFGDDRIAYRAVTATAAHQTSRLARGMSPVQLRVVSDPAGGTVTVGDAERTIQDDLVRVVQDTLRHGRLVDPEADGGTRAIEANDIAVLVAANRVAEHLAAALRRSGIPAVFGGADSVARSPAAVQWRLLLAALDRPTDPRLARAAAMGWILGHDGDDVARWTDEQLAELQAGLHDLAGLLARNGMPALWGALRVRFRVVERLMARAGGERDLTDLEHLAELLHADLRGRGASSARALEALDELIDHATELDEVAERRLESDADAVQVLTIHRAKGLEYPVVLCPHIWRKHDPSSSKPPGVVPVAHPGLHQPRTIDLAWVARADSGPVVPAVAREELGEDLRKLYVAATRAQHRLVLWLPLSEGCELGALGRVLGLSSTPASLADVRAALGERSRAAQGGLEVVAADGVPDRERSWERAIEPAGLADQAAQVGRSLVEPGRRWSFTGIVAHADADPASQQHPGTLGHDLEPSDAAADDESLGPVDAADAGTGALRSRADALLVDLPAGPDIGTAVHELLERANLAADDLPAELDRVADLTGLPPSLASHRGSLVAGLARAIETPLGPILAGRRLGDVGAGDRLAELRFDLPLPRDEPAAVVADIGHVLLAHLDVDDVLHPFARDLVDFPSRAPLVGVLTGSIDAVVRVTSAAGQVRYVVVDYKTNRLGRFDRPDPLAPYHPDALIDAMVEHHYPLQALLYLVALHRYLRWRLRDPDPPVASVAYLFLRGMLGADGPTVGGRPFGAFTWQPPPGLVPALSDLLAGRHR